MSAENEPHATGGDDPAAGSSSGLERSAWFTTRVTWALPDRHERALVLAPGAATRQGRADHAAGVVTGAVDAEPRDRPAAGQDQPGRRGQLRPGRVAVRPGRALRRSRGRHLDEPSTSPISSAAVFFSLGGYARRSCRRSTPARHRRPGRRGSAVALVAVRAAPLGWLSAAVLFVGTLPLRRQPGGGVRRGPHPAPVERLDLASRHHSAASASSCRVTSRLLEVGERHVRLHRPTSLGLVGRRGQPVRLGACSSSPGSPRSSARRPRRRVNVGHRQLGDLHRVPSASPSAGSSSSSTTPATDTEVAVHRRPTRCMSNDTSSPQHEAQALFGNRFLTEPAPSTALPPGRHAPDRRDAPARRGPRDGG